LRLRRDPRILKLPPYLSLLCILVGVVWLFLLPLDEYSRRTYISENALLPGQVHTYFGGSDQHVFRAYKQEVNEAADKSNVEYAFWTRECNRQTKPSRRVLTERVQSQ
jgi:GPI-anchor transamidase subunit GAA1